jgi:DNA-binding NtrC family response regulator
MRKFSERMGKRIQGISQEAIGQMQSYDWPGNVRELANMMERAVIFCQGSTLNDSQIALAGPTGMAAVESSGSIPTLEEAERKLILEALEKTNGVLAGPTGAAQLLGINRSTLWSRMRKLGITIPKSKGVASGKMH